MNVMEAIRKRRSVRAYLDKPVEEEKLQLVLEAARLAPSARNIQEWKFVVVRDAATRARLADAARGQRFVGEAPVVIAACSTVTNYTMTCGQRAYPIDLAIALDHMTLKAAEEGLGTCWIGAFYEDKAREILAIPPEVPIVALLCLGYPAEPLTAADKPRKAMADIVVFEKWL